MAIEAVSYYSGSSHDPYRGRIALQIFADDRFVASYRHRQLVKLWGGRLAAGTFVRACEALSTAGFPGVPPFHELIPSRFRIELGWLNDRRWEHGETLDADTFARFITLTSMILAVLDPDLARMPPGETTPVTDQRRFEV